MAPSASSALPAGDGLFIAIGPLPSPASMLQGWCSLTTPPHWPTIVTPIPTYPVAHGFPSPGGFPFSFLTFPNFSAEHYSPHFGCCRKGVKIPRYKYSVTTNTALLQENYKKWKEFTNLKPGTYMTYKGRQYSERDEHKLMKAIIAQMKSFNDEEERKRQKKIKT
jgi:hypothetical protein